VPFTVLEQGDMAISITQRTNYRITNAGDLAALWSLIYGNGSGVQPVPDIDFSKYEVLAVFDGSHSSNDYGISVEQIVDANAVRTVTIQHTSPGPSCHTSSQSTSPFELIQVPVTTFTLAHQDDMATTTCN
jgi:hypothetical protein